MKRLNEVLAFVCVVAGFAMAGEVTAVAADSPSFEQQVVPFLRKYCVGCHDGGDDSQGGLDLRTHGSLLEGGNNGPALVPGKSGESRLVGMLAGTIKPAMPPKDSRQPALEEIEAVRRWIDAGAKAPAEGARSASRVDIALPLKPTRAISPAVVSLAYAPNDTWVAAGRGREVVLIDSATGALRETLKGAAHRINAVAVSSNGLLVAAAEGEAGTSGAALVWELGKPDPKRLAGHTDSIYAIDFSPDGTRLLTGSYDKLLILWNVATGEQIATLKHHTGPVYSAQFSPDGKSLVSCGADQTVKLWNAETGERILTLSEATKGVNAAVFHPQGNELAAGGVDRTIRVYEWNGTTARFKRGAFAHDAAILALAYSPDGSTLFSSSEDRRVKAWDVATLRERHTYELQPDWPLTLAVNHAGTHLACGLFNGALPVFDTRSASRVQQLLAAAPVSEEPGQSIALALAVVEDAAPSPAAAPAAPNPPTPRFDSISPRSVSRGQTVVLTLSGQNLASADRLFVSPGQLQARLLPNDGKNSNQVQCEVDLPADLDPGLVSLRLHTPLGSAGTKSFYAGPFAETGEIEPNNATGQATPVMLPTTLSGSIASRGDLDLWAFDAPAGAELVFQLVGPALGSSLNARLSLRDSTGKLLANKARSASQTDLFLQFAAPAAGRYFLEVQDRDNTGSGNHFYLVHAGEFSLATGIFPLAIRGSDQGAHAADEITSLTATGFRLDPAAATIGPSQGVGPRSVVPRGTAGKSLTAVRYEQTAWAEFVEAEPNDDPGHARLLPVPGGISGRISPRASGAQTDVDFVAFDARQGERLTIEALARRLGSPLDTVIDLVDAQGQPVPRHTLRSVAETYTELRDHDSRSRGIRLHNWEDLQPGDFVMLGSEVVKVQILPLGPDEDIKFFERGGLRRGYLGTTPEAHAINSGAFKVEVHPPEQTFPPNGMPVVQLPWRNDDGGTGFQSDSVLYFDAPADGRYFVRLRDLRGLSGDDFFYRLVIRRRREDFRVSIDPENPNIPRGGVLPVNVTVERLDDFNGPIDVRLEGLPAGFAASTTRIGPDLFTGVIQIAADESAVNPAGDDGLQWRAIAAAAIEGQRVERTSATAFGAHQVSVTSPPDLKVVVEPSTAEIEPGQEVKFTVSIERRNGFQGRVPVDVLNLPHGLRVLDVGLNGVLINENETSRSFVVTCDPWATGGSWPFFAAARVESKNERHGSALLMLTVRIPGRVAERQ